MENSILSYKGIRVKTGCLTCRKRRVKCDELKPICKRCIKANVICDGYQKKRSVPSPKPGIKTPPCTEAETESTSVSSIERTASFSPESARYIPSPRSPLSAPIPPSPRTRHRSELAFYHHFVTSTAPRLFDLEHITFWRDHVGSMAWGNDLVFKAVLAIGGIHQAYLLSASELTTESMMQSKVSGLRSYGETLRLMESHTKKDGYTDMQPAIVAGVLLAYCECIMNHIKPAALHLKAAGQLLSPSLSLDESPYPAGYEALHATIAKLDFLAQSIVPYSQPSIQKDSFDACNYIDVPDSFSKGSVHRSVSSERVELVQIISRFNHLDNIIWGPWSSKSSRPTSEALSRFQMDLLYWRANSPLTFDGCSESLAVLPDCCEPLDELPIPPEPLFFQSSYVALSVALYNNYMACSFSMLSNGQDLDRNALCAFHYVYQNLRIAEGLTAATIQESENIDINMSLLLYLGFRRCYSREWQTWTIQKLRQCGQQGLLDGSAFANTLENIYHLQLRAELQSNYAMKPTYNTTGLLHSRILPLLQPKDESDKWVAYYLRPTANLDHEDVTLCIIARASWRQDKRGNMASVQFNFYDDLAVADVDVASLRDWIQSLEASSLPRDESI
ncbi:hypothetical protein CFAM422_009583 [Trichoderma lentiforme]|uniref:Zn(2)-C6 fungal-type domain-containing protein n=1 Tax=Trichoderma lentiforme TaxID=1567552 RepID=A0A9P5C8N8_9HYPO|nr:hypothetical protein CFAM422_009583 [Trichoderma lentiforme]